MSRMTAIVALGLAGCLTLAGCNKPTTDGPAAQDPLRNNQIGQYLIVDTRTDDGKADVCKQQAAEILVKMNDEADKLCLVGLWAYNPPAMLSAVRDAGLLGKVRIVAFDEADETLQGIIDGHIYGTVVQQPFRFGYDSVKIMAAHLRGDNSAVPADGIVSVPHRTIKKEDAAAFREELQKLIKGGDVSAAAGTAAAGERVKIAVISNNVFEFWTYCQRGAERAAAEFNVELEFHRPKDGTAEDQKRIVEDVLVKGVQGIVISPNDSKNSQEFLDRVADQVPVICMDNDLPPGSKRLCYVGTQNVVAGKAAGDLVTEVMPEGGKIVVFVGKMDAKNAQERHQGLREALAETAEKQ